MTFMLMMHTPRAVWKDTGLGTWPPADIMPLEVRQVISRPPEDL